MITMSSIELNMMWFCQSCQHIVSGDRMEHFKNRHYFKPRVLLLQPTEPRQEFDFWYHECVTNTICPICRTQTDMMISATEKSVRFDCSNKECSKVIFYRRVTL